MGLLARETLSRLWQILTGKGRLAGFVIVAAMLALRANEIGRAHV